MIMAPGRSLNTEAKELSVVVRVCASIGFIVIFFFSSRRRHTRSTRDRSSDVCSSDLGKSLGRCARREHRGRAAGKAPGAAGIPAAVLRRAGDRNPALPARRIAAAPGPRISAGMEAAMSALLACRGLSVRFGGLVALDALDLEVRQGGILGLIGPNGSGKTTFFNVITGVYSAAAGEARFGGEDLTRLTPQRIYAAGITRTFQRSRLALPLSIFDNIMIGNHRLLDHRLWFNLFRRAALKRQLEENLEKAKALVAAFSKRLARRMFDAVGAFSMIDRRRIEICRALVSEPRLLLLDEPSAGMTHEETRELMDDILSVRSRIPGLTIVIIEHEMGVIERITDRCVVLNYGRKISEGAYPEVARDPQVQEAYLGKE